MTARLELTHGFSSQNPIHLLYLKINWNRVWVLLKPLSPNFSIKMKWKIACFFFKQ